MYGVAPLALMLSVGISSPRQADAYPRIEEAAPVISTIRMDSKAPVEEATVPSVLTETPDWSVDPLRNVQFAYRSAVVPKGALPLLTGIASVLKADRRRYVTVIAYADHHGSNEFSVALAGMRAAAVKAELVRLGVRRTQVRNRSRGSEMASASG